jgi:phosphotriesterase-related protein
LLKAGNSVSLCCKKRSIKPGLQSYNEKNKLTAMKIYPYLILSALLIIIVSCSDDAPEKYIMTVQGPVPASEMGQWLSHEHVLVDWIGADSTGYHRWVKDSVITRVLPFLEEVKQLGVSSFADCSPAFLGRDPVLLLNLSERSGIHILTNTGYYGAVDNRFIPGYAWEESAEDLARRWIYEFENGIDGSGVKPGFVKIGVREQGPLSDLHRKLITAAALTHKETGLPIKSHTGGDIPAFEQLEILKSAGVSPAAFMWTHAQNGSLEKQIEAASGGAWISLDGVNISSSGENKRGNLDWYIDRLSELRSAGVIDQVLISHDAGWYDAGEINGGDYRGYSDIHRYLLPALRDNGFSDDDINKLVTDNPSRAFEIRIRLLN